MHEAYFQAATHPVPLTKKAIQKNVDSFLAVANDVPGEYWEAEHLLEDRPEKWTFSSAIYARDNTVLGYAIASQPGPDYVHLHHLMVHGAGRGCGIGAKLLDDLVAKTASRGIPQLQLKVHSQNEGAIRFYLRNEFQRHEESDGYVVMRRDAEPVKRSVAIHQPNYLPWCGYFAKCRAADLFVILDDAQMPGGQSYVTRTKVANSSNSNWLSIPIRRQFGELILDVQFADLKWRKKHLGTLRAQYGRTPFFKEVMSWLEPIYGQETTSLAEFNQAAIRGVCDYLEIDTPFILSSQIETSGMSDDRLIEIVSSLSGTIYISGKGGCNYQDEEKFTRAGIELAVCSYQPIEYEQRGETFQPGLSIVDALFNVGQETVNLLRYPETEKLRHAA